MRKIILISLFFISAYAHTLLLNIFNNEDNTITVEGVYSTGENASGALIRVESLVSGEILYKKRLPQSSELTIDIPKEPYQIVLDGGPGHTIIKDGVPPLEGFEKKLEKKEKAKVTVVPKNTNKQSDLYFYFLLIIAMLFILTIYFSFKNTNKILGEIKQKNASSY